MIDSGSPLQRLIRELKRRRVLRVAAVYAAAAWLVVEVSDTVAPLLLLPHWTSTLVLVLVLLGFPVVIALAWTFDITSGGLERTAPSVRGPSGGSVEGAEPAAGPATAAALARWTAGRIAVIGAVAVLAVAGAAMLFTGGDLPFPMLGNRVAVLPFENRTGDPELDDLGLVAADLITGGLTAIDTVQVVPTSAVRELLAEAGAVSDPLPALTRETRAGLVVTGTYVLIGDSLEVRAQLVDPREGRVLASFEPTRSHRSDPTAALGATRERVMGAVATRLRANSAEWPAMVSRPPNYQAYRAYLLGLELFNSLRYAEAIPEFDRARELDSTLWTALFWTASAFGNMGQPAKQDSVHRLMEPHRSELLDVERIWLDWQAANLRGDLAAAHRAARRAYERAPGSLGRYLTALYALHVNRPRETVALLREEPATSRSRASWYYFHAVLAHALHLLGEHHQELEAARESRTFFSDQPGPLFLEARALTGLGRPAEAEALVDEMLLLTSGPVAGYVRQLGDVLDAHGHHGAAGRIYARALEALREQGPPEATAGKTGRAEVSDVSVAWARPPNSRPRPTPRIRPAAAPTRWSGSLRPSAETGRPPSGSRRSWPPGRTRTTVAATRTIARASAPVSAISTGLWCCCARLTPRDSRWMTGSVRTRTSRGSGGTPGTRS